MNAFCCAGNISVAGISLYFFFSSTIKFSSFPSDFENDLPVYCILEDGATYPQPQVDACSHRMFSGKCFF